MHCDINTAWLRVEDCKLLTQSSSMLRLLNESTSLHSATDHTVLKRVTCARKWLLESEARPRASASGQT